MATRYFYLVAIFFISMRRFLLSLLIIIAYATQTYAQRCTTKQDIHPLTDSVCQIINSEVGYKLFIENNSPQTKTISIDFITPAPISVSIGDSAQLTLKDGSVIKFCSIRNSKYQRDEVNLFWYNQEYYSVLFYSKIQPSLPEDSCKPLIIRQLNVNPLSKGFHTVGP